MRPGYLQGYGEDRSRPGNFGYQSIIKDRPYRFLVDPSDTGMPSEYETGYIPEYMRYSKVFPDYPVVINRPFVRPRDPRTFNVLMI